MNLIKNNKKNKSNWVYISIIPFVLWELKIETLNLSRNSIKVCFEAPNPYTNIIGGQNRGNFGSKKANFGENVKNIKNGYQGFKI